MSLPLLRVKFVKTLYQLVVDNFLAVVAVVVVAKVLQRTSTEEVLAHARAIRPSTRCLLFFWRPPSPTVGHAPL
jgi:hypothetical protein